jgi:putative membrane protein
MLSIRTLPCALLAFASLAVHADGFVEQASVASQAEIQASQQALQGTLADDTRHLARRLNEDHFALLQQLRALSAQLAIVLPDDATLAELASKAQPQPVKGLSADAAFATAQIAAHQQAVRLFSQEAQATDAPAELKAFAEQHLPLMQRHLQMAQRLLKTHKK